MQHAVDGEHFSAFYNIIKIEQLSSSSSSSSSEHTDLHSISTDSVPSLNNIRFDAMQVLPGKHNQLKIDSS